MLLLSILALAQGSITVSFPPTPLPKALETISKLSGLKLQAAPSLKDEVLVAHLKGADTNLVLSRMAETLRAEWEIEKDGTRFLKPDVAALKKLRQEKEQADLKILQGSIAYIQKRLAEQPEELDTAFAARQKLKEQQEEERRKKAVEAQDWSRAFASSSTFEETPGWRATARLILLIPQKALLAMSNNERAVWAESPTPMQNAFSPAAAPILAKFRRELHAFDPSMEVTRVRLRFTKWETKGAFNVQLDGLGADGKVLTTGFVRMNNDADLLKVPFDQRTKNEPKEGEKPITLDPEWIEARTFMSTDQPKAAKERNDLLAKWKPRLMAPTQWEPTRWFEGADIMEAAQESDRNLIGTVGDITGSMYQPLKKTPTPSQVLVTYKRLLRETKDGWLLLFVDEPRARASRAKGEALIKDSLKRGGVSVDAAAAWTCSMPDKWPMLGWITDHLQTLFPGALNTTIDDEALRMWGAFTELQMMALRRGDTLRLANLTPAAKSQIHRLAFWYQGLGEQIEPSEALPTGITDGTVKLSVEETPVFTAWYSKNGDIEVRFPWNAKQFGTYLAKGDTYREIPVEQFRSMDRFRMGVKRVYKLLFALEPGAVPMEIELTESLFDPSAKVLDKLTPELLAEVEKARIAALAKPATPDKERVIPPR